MNNLERRQIESLIRIDNFGRENAADFPADSVGGQSFAAIAQAVAELETLGAVRSTANDEKLSGTARRKMAREELYDDLARISATARTIALDNEEFANKFRLPRDNRNDQTMLETARAFAEQAVPLKDDFIAYGLPADFVTDLTADITAFETAFNLQDEAGRERVEANAAIDALIEQAMVARRKLDVIVPNVFRGNAGKLADWASASHVERASQKQTVPITQPVV